MQTPRIPMPPKFDFGWTLQDGQPVKRELYNTMVEMIEVVNTAVDSLPILEPVQ